MRVEIESEVVMSCLSETGLVLPRARRLLETVGNGATLDEIAVGLRLPEYRVRSSLREAGTAGLVEEDLGVYRLTSGGAEALRRSGVVTPMRAGSDQASGQGEIAD